MTAMAERAWQIWIDRGGTFTDCIGRDPDTGALRVVKLLTDEGIRTNVTLCFSPLQAVLAAKAGATYISPFVGRLDDVGHEGMEIVGQILEIYGNYGFDTKVLVASVRSPTHVLQALRMGADVATLPLKVIDQLIKHPLTDVGLARFIADAAKIPTQG